VEKIKVGIIGTGYTIGIAKAHVEGYANVEGCELVALHDIVPGRAGEYKAKEKLENATAYDDLEAFLSAVDAVSVCAHNSAHVGLLEKCLAAGKHVIVEKPLADTLSEAKRALEIEKKYPGKVAMVVFNRRELPGIAYIKDAVDKGTLGKIFFFRYVIGGNRIGDAEKVKLEWRMQKNLSGSGTLADFVYHALDLADYIVCPSMGRITQVGCFTSIFTGERYGEQNNAKAEVTNDDAAVVIARTEGGALISITTCRHNVPQESVDVGGEGGTITHVIDHGTATTHFRPLNGSFTGPYETSPIGDEFKGPQKHAGVLGEFIRCIQTGARPSRSIERGYYIQKLTDALERSAATGTMIEVGK
jgi:predicted dehydrogenase